MSNMFDPWISVNDCLPETFRPVIICRTIGKGERRVEQGHMDLGGWWKVYGTRTKSVTHWMPLPPPPREMPPMPVTEYCKGCIHLFGTMDHTPLCQYILHAGRCRPCPAGDGCTVKETERTIDMKKRTWDASRARQLYDEGLDDLTIADMVGATEGAIKAWRAANHLKTNVATPKNTEEPQTETTPKMPPPCSVSRAGSSCCRRASVACSTCGWSGEICLGPAGTRALCPSPSGAHLVLRILRGLPLGRTGSYYSPVGLRSFTCLRSPA